MEVKLCNILNSIYRSAKNNDNRAKQRYCLGCLTGESKNRIENPKAMKISNLFKENQGWRNAQEFFLHNGTDDRIYRLPSPDKITS